MFTQFKDYQRLISTENLSVIINEDTSLLRQMELTAQEEIESYLRHHFDVSKMFNGFEAWNPSKAYLSEDKTLVSYEGNEGSLYLVNTDTLAGESPETEPTKWTQSDTRHQYLLTIFIDVTLYHAHSRINPRNIPDFRVERYRDAILWLDKVNKGFVSPDFPIKPEPILEGRKIHYGTSKIDTNTY